MFLLAVWVLALASATCTFAQDDRLYSYICLAAQDQLCLGISADGDPVYNPRSLYFIQVKHRERVEIRQEDHLRTRWSVFPATGTIQLTNFTSLCLAKRILSNATPGDLVLRPCGTTGNLEDWDLLNLIGAADTSDETSLRLKSLPGQCLTMMSCERNGGFCSKNTAVVYTGGIPRPTAQRGAYVKLMPCANRFQLAQTWTQSIDCAPGCSPFMINGPNNTCDAACANAACNWDNGACATPRPTPPTFTPTKSPTTTAPSLAPSNQPTISAPSAAPSTPLPSASPSKAPTTSFPTQSPTPEPTVRGTRQPTTLAPTTRAPSASPTVLPSASPTSVTTPPQTSTTTPTTTTSRPSSAPTFNSGAPPPADETKQPTATPRGVSAAPSSAPSVFNNTGDLTSGSSNIGRRLWYVWLIIALVLLIILALLCCLCFCVPAKKKKPVKKLDEGPSAAAAAGAGAGKQKDIESQAVKRPMNADVANELELEDGAPAKKKPAPVSMEGLGGGGAAEAIPEGNTQVVDPSSTTIPPPPPAAGVTDVVESHHPVGEHVHPSHPSLNHNLPG